MDVLLSVAELVGSPRAMLGSSAMGDSLGVRSESTEVGDSLGVWSESSASSVTGDCSAAACSSGSRKAPGSGDPSRSTSTAVARPPCSFRIISCHSPVSASSHPSSSSGLASRTCSAEHFHRRARMPTHTVLPVCSTTTPGPHHLSRRVPSRSDWAECLPARLHTKTHCPVVNCRLECLCPRAAWFTLSLADTENASWRALSLI